MPRCPRALACDYGRLTQPPRPKVDEVRIRKGDHELHLLAKGTVLRTYRVALGYGGPGQKRMEGDATTPMGEYRITSRLEKTRWHTFLGVSYPNVDDQRRHAYPQPDATS